MTEQIKKELFWLIEKNDLDGLKNFCKRDGTEHILNNLYSMQGWDQWFPRNDPQTKTIKVYMCGVMDFSPLQHAIDIQWLQGALLLTNYCKYGSQGCGLPIVNIEKFREYCQTNGITIN